MRSVLLAAAILITFTACDRRPVQVDIPVKNAPQNSVDHSGRHPEVLESSPGAASTVDELQFIDTMIVHHEGAIDMAQLVQTRAAHPELRSLAAEIIRDQQNEIAQLRAWREKYFKNASPAINTDLPGMSVAMADMDVDKLDLLKENAFDLEFLRQMIPHHEGAVEMARYILSKPLGQPAELRDPLRTLAQSIIDSQAAEISKMKEWQKAWTKQP
jgi:uncharacterized protein (DUF305 family)